MLIVRVIGHYNTINMKVEVSVINDFELIFESCRYIDPIPKFHINFFNNSNQKFQ